MSKAFEQYRNAKNLVSKTAREVSQRGLKLPVVDGKVVRQGAAAAVSTFNLDEFMKNQELLHELYEERRKQGITDPIKF